MSLEPHDAGLSAEDARAVDHYCAFHFGLEPPAGATPTPSESEHSAYQNAHQGPRAPAESSDPEQIEPYLRHHFPNVAT